MDWVYRLDGTKAESNANAAGPWNPGLQHGSAPASLVARVVENLPTPVPMQVTRLTLDLLRPIPIGMLEIEAKVVREGKKIQLCAVSLLADGVEVVRASALKVRTAPAALHSQAQGPALDVGLPEDGTALDTSVAFASPFVAGLDMRIVKGDLRQIGPTAGWFNARRPIIEGQSTTPLMRAAIAADFCNGMSRVVDFRDWTFINGDLTVHLARLPVGDWVLLDAETWAGESGSAIAFGRLADRYGYFGRATQSVLLERR